jgi:hypothetical protein
MARVDTPRYIGAMRHIMRRVSMLIMRYNARGRAEVLIKIRLLCDYAILADFTPCHTPPYIHKVAP